MFPVHLNTHRTNWSNIANQLLKEASRVAMDSTVIAYLHLACDKNSANGRLLVTSVKCYVGTIWKFHMEIGISTL